MRDLEQVINRPHHHSPAPGVGAAPLGDDARNGPRVGRDFRRRLRIIGQDLFDRFLRVFGGYIFSISSRTAFGSGAATFSVNTAIKCPLHSSVHCRRSALACAHTDCVLNRQNKNLPVAAVSVRLARMTASISFETDLSATATVIIRLASASGRHPSAGQSPPAPPPARPESLEHPHSLCPAQLPCGP